mmetsp:Transcript_28591/g.49909  ORF Transcript_28591/g.49909 Transcript_28591/m.49909 type:complete len:101 (-) Transcript_28591:216-518(-)
MEGRRCTGFANLWVAGSPSRQLRSLSVQIFNMKRKRQLTVPLILAELFGPVHPNLHYLKGNIPHRTPDCLMNYRALDMVHPLSLSLQKFESNTFEYDCLR